MCDIKNVLVVDCDFKAIKSIKEFLICKNIDVIEAENIEYATNVFFNNLTEISLVLLDIVLLKKDNWQLLKTIRQYSTIPVVIFTNNRNEADEIKAFSLGADEYIGKPFHYNVLFARVEAIWRRVYAIKHNELSVGKLKINRTMHTVTNNEVSIYLTQKEFELLAYFMENRGVALSREHILNAVWRYDYGGDARTVDTHIKKLRHKLGETGNYIKTLRCVGYKFEAEEESKH